MSTNLQRYLGAFALVVAGMLIGLAVQVLPARLMAMPGDDLRDNILNSEDFSDADFAAFVAARSAAAAWHGFAEYDDELAAAYTARAARKGASDIDAAHYYSLSRQAQENALMLEPSDAYGWAQMAFLTTQTSADDLESASDYLRMSIETAPYEPKLMPSRLDMMIGLRDFLTSDEQAQIPDVARAAWDADPYITITNAHRHTYLDIVENALSDDDKETAHYNQMVKDLAFTPPAAD